MRSTATARRRSTSVALLAGGTLLALATTACGPDNGSSVTTKPKAAAGATSAAASTSGVGTPGSPAAGSNSSKPSSTAKVGDTIGLKGMDKGASDDVTVVKVTDNVQSTDGYLKPADGKRWIAVQFRLKNTGTAAYSDAPENGAKVVDDQGQSYGAEAVTDTTAGQAFATPVNLAPGDSALGVVTFEVPATAKIVKAQFGLDSGFADQTGQWTLN
ncbi:DUF4352 domain-containing protein [Kitasatospora sp. LaBMicrA B282]|uniref:DUF4352 domain-containing protein n=1 Tax=Kitasatospora sp. LaBMicrA B282 TaxID=3420949 RepID=UPI003D0B0D98